jgi:hypothetical protein
VDQNLPSPISNADALLNYLLQQLAAIFDGAEPVMVNCGREPARNHQVERIPT